MGKIWWFKCFVFLGMVTISVGVLVSKHRSVEPEPVRLVVRLDEDVFLAHRADAFVDEIADYLVDEGVKAKVTRENDRQILISFDRVEVAESASDKTLHTFGNAIQEVTRNEASIRVRIKHEYEQELVRRARENTLNNIEGRLNKY